MNRKLIRPNMIEIKEKIGRTPKTRQFELQTVVSVNNDGHPHSGNGSNLSNATGTHAATCSRRRIAPPEQTNAENFYYLKQMQAKTPMVVVLQDGEKIRGVIEWYDKHCLKINRVKEPNILLPKHNIKYIYKQEDEPRLRRVRANKEAGIDPNDCTDTPIFEQ